MTTSRWRRALGACSAVVVLTLGGCATAHEADSPGRESAERVTRAQQLGDGSVHDPAGLPVYAEHAALAGLLPDVHAAVLAAAERAAEEGLELRLSSGWRSAELQQRLLDDAIRDYGSEAEAREWVDTPERSSHVTGEAVDIAGLEEALWVGQHGAEFGLCQTYANERWHFELSELDPGGACPAPPFTNAAGRPE